MLIQLLAVKLDVFKKWLREKALWGIDRSYKFPKNIYSWFRIKLLLISMALKH